MRKQRQQYSAEFKAKVALEAIKGVHTVNEITERRPRFTTAKGTAWSEVIGVTNAARSWVTVVLTN